MNNIIQDSNICHMQNFVDGTWMYLVHQDTPLMPSFLVNYWRHDIAPSTLPETNETSKWSRWCRDPQMMSPDSTYTVKKDMSPNFRKPFSKGKSLQTTFFFPLEHVTFRSFRNNFSNPTRILNRYIIYASIQMDTNPYDTHPWITFQTAF